MSGIDPVQALQFIGAGLNIYNSYKNGQKANSNENQAVQQQNAFLGYDKDLLNEMHPAYSYALQNAEAPAYSSLQYINPYNDANTDLAYQPYQEDIGRTADNSVAALRNDMAMRGIRSSTGFDNGAAMIRRGQAHDTSAIRANMRYQGGIARYNDAKAAEDARFQRLSTMLSPMSAILGNASGNAGSLVQTYANQQALAGGSLASGLGALGSIASPGRTPPDPNAGNNRTSTNQVATPGGVTMPQYPNPVPQPNPDPYNRPTLTGNGMYS